MTAVQQNKTKGRLRDNSESLYRASYWISISRRSWRHTPPPAVHQCHRVITSIPPSSSSTATATAFLCLIAAISSVYQVHIRYEYITRRMYAIYWPIFNNPPTNWITTHRNGWCNTLLVTNMTNLSSSQYPPRNWPFIPNYSICQYKYIERPIGVGAFLSAHLLDCRAASCELSAISGQFSDVMG